MISEEQKRLIEELIAPETALEKKLISREEYINGLFWGKPRYGHPEGNVIYHIREVLDNVDRIPNLDSGSRELLRIVTLVHDIFKYKEHEERKTQGRMPDNHHAHFAAEFIKEFTNNEALISIIRLHDEAYYCWKLLRFDRLDDYEVKLSNLMDQVQDYIQLYYLFFKCDTQTGDKTQEPLLWFEKEIPGIDVVEF